MTPPRGREPRPDPAHRAAHRSAREEPTPTDDADVARAGSYILPGGKVDEAAIRSALDKAQAPGGDHDPDRGPGDDDEALRRVTFELKRDLRKRLDKYLTDRIGFMSRNQLQRLIEEGGVLVNGEARRASTLLRQGDVVDVSIPPPTPTNIQPEDIPLDVMHEDEHLIVINKRPDIIVHPARSHLKGTMLGALAYHFAHRSARGGGLSGVGTEFARPGVVHRLDRHTSGCIVFAKDDEAHWKLGRQFELRTVDKRYLALVHGRVEPVVFPIDLPIGPHPSREKGYREKYVVRHDALGKPALTVCRVRERYRVPGAPTGFTLVELELKTGRTHQIRVHLSSQGWPIVGDDMYDGKALALVTGRAPHVLAWSAGAMGESLPAPDPRATTLLSRQALHAATLAFRHPVDDRPMSFAAPLRADMLNAVHVLRDLSAGGERVEAPGATIDLAALLDER